MILNRFEIDICLKSVFLCDNGKAKWDFFKENDLWQKKKTECTCSTAYPAG